MNQKKEYGFSQLLTILTIVAVIVVVGFIAWRIYDAQPKAAPNTNGQTNSSGSQTDPNAGYVVIQEWRVRFKPTDGLTNVEYFKPKSITSDAFSVITKELADKEINCSTDSSMIPIGLLSRNINPHPANGEILTVIDGYTYQYRSSGAACSENEANFALESKVTGLVGSSVRSLEAIQ